MSRNNLLLSLLANNPNSRSNSLANKKGLSPTISFFPRSTSTSLQKIEKKESNKMQTSTYLFKMAYMLNVKLKQSYYFAFCKLQQIYRIKKSKIDQSKSQQINQKIQNPCLQIQKQLDDQEVKITNFQLQKPSLTIILSKVCDWHSAFITKVKPKSENLILRKIFDKILETSSINCSLNKLEKFIQKRSILNLKSFFQRITIIQNTRIKLIIFVDTLSQLTNKIILSSLKQIQILPHKFKNEQNESISSVSKFSQSKTEPNCVQTSIFQTSMLTHRHKKQVNQTNAQKASKCMKIKIKEKNTTTTSKPIKLEKFRNKKALKFNLKEPSKILIDENIFNDKNQPKNILINLHQQHLNNPFPDFTDSCNIFSTLPDFFDQQLFWKNRHVTQQFLLQHRKSVEMLPTQDGSLTERIKTAEILGQQKYNKSVSFKHNSLGKMKTKKVINISRSPLKKVEELYKTVQFYNSISASNKQKKLININLPNFLHEQPEKTRVIKTPIKLQYQQAYASHSKGKQNTLNKQRLINEREKQKIQKGGLQNSGTKYKSSMITRQKKLKPDKIQLSTARKMKMQIENIISRRNKQLGRNQLYQLK